MGKSVTIKKIFQKAISLFTVLILVLTLNALVLPAASAAGSSSSTSTTQTASSSNSLPSDSTQSGQASAMGFATDQPARLSPSGKEVDKTKSPLGSNAVTMNRINQLAVFQGFSMNVYNNPLGTSRMFSNNPASAVPQLSAAAPVATDIPTALRSNPIWDIAERASVAADVDGNGTQEMVTAGLLPASPDGKTVTLHLLVADYSSLSTSGGRTTPTAADYTVAASIKNPSNGANYDQSLKITAGDYNHDGNDEIAIAVGSTLYICQADLSSETLLSSNTINNGGAIFSSITDLETADANGDGFQELLVTAGSGVIASSNPAKLYIYSGVDLSKPAATIKLCFTDSDGTTKEYFTNPSVTVGDAFGDGNKSILIGGRTDRGDVAIAYLLFHADTEMYDTAPVTGYLLTASDFKAVNGDLGIRCVSLATPVSGTPEYIVLGGFIFQFDQSTGAFDRIDVTTYTNTSGLKGNSNSVSHGSITDVNVSKDDTYILGTYVGNFDGNTLGQEQIIILHYNKWYDKDYVYVTTCGMNSAGAINASLEQMWKKGDAYTYPAICSIDIFNNGTRLVFEPEKSTFMFSNPTVLAVLGATPYYSELADKYGALGNVGTTFGTENTSESSTSNGITASVGVSFGYEQGFGILGIQFGEVSFETTVTNSFAYTWTKSKSVSKSLSFTGYYSDDSVVAMVVPYDVYYYKVYSYNNATHSTVESEMCMTVPYSPMTTIMPLTDYNKAAQNIQNAPTIGSDVLKHTVGDPRSYPQSSTGLTNVSGTTALTGGNSSNEAENFVAAGTGNNSVEQSITTSNSSSKSFDYSLDVDISFNASLFGVTAGASASVGYTRNATTTTTASTTMTGSVASVPSGYDKYNFNWCLAAYNYNLKAGSSTQECTVISYLVKPIGSFPPAVPANFRVTSQALGSTVLQWDQASCATGYRVARSTTGNDGTFTNVSGDLAGKAATSFTDTTGVYGQTYYYQLVATGSSNSLPTDPLCVSPLKITGLTVKSQPKLTYTEGDSLNLTALSVTMSLSDGSSKTVQYGDFSKNNLTTSLANGVGLTASQTGIPITISYTPANFSVNTNTLTVNAKSQYDLTMNVVFKVGSTNKAAVLAPNTTLTAAISLQNNTASVQDVLVILVLYSDKGTMVNYSYQHQTVAASGSSSLSEQLGLPSSVAGYTAKVIVIDGKDFSSTTLTPKAATAQISA